MKRKDFAMRPSPFRLMPASAAVVVLAAGIGLLLVSGCAQANTKAAPSAAVVATFNKDCPIMGGPADPKLTRIYNGKTIGFCCPGCPDAWDKLTDAQKELALAGAKPNAEHIRQYHSATKARGAYIE
jgi:hypothetical protein